MRAETLPNLIARMHRAPTPLSLALLLFSVGCTSLGVPRPSMPSMPSFSTAKAAPGSPEWWKKNKKKAEFVPQMGYQVAGVEGYFDQEGRPVDSRVAKVVNRKKAGGLLGDAGFTRTVGDIKESVGLGPDEQLARTAFAEGEDLFRKEKYAAAAKRFKETVARWPDSQLEQDAMFQLAESYFFAEAYPDAVDAYEALIQKYPSTMHLDKVVRRQFSLGQYWESHHQYDPDWAATPNLFDKRRPLFDTLGRALKVYENIRLNDPTGPLADDAVMATANSYFLRGRYVDADEFYDLLRKEYPRSDHQYEAHILGLQCKLRKYQGADYDGTPLEEAQKLVKQLKIQFAGELNQEQRERLTEIEAQLAFQLAQRVHSMAEYFENKQDYGAARIYYGDLVHNYPESSLAGLARDRLAALDGKPNRPDEPLEFLIKHLPENAERAAVAQVPLIQRPATTLPQSTPQTQLAEREQPGGSSNPPTGPGANEPTYQR